MKTEEQELLEQNTKTMATIQIFTTNSLKKNIKETAINNLKTEVLKLQNNAGLAQALEFRNN